MKQRKYTLSDKEYFYGFFVLFRELYAEKIPSVLVGGAAVQARIAAKLSGGRSLGDISLENCLRKTDDYDICTLSKDSQILNLLPRLNTEEEIGEEIYSLEVIRNGCAKPKIVVNSLSDEKEIMINFSKSASDANYFKEYYNEMIDSSDEFLLRYGPMEAKIKVAKPEYLIISKLMRLNERDLIDIKALLNLESIDEERIKKLMGREAHRFREFKRKYPMPESSF